MGKVTKSVRVAERAIHDLLDVQSDDSVLIISDETGMDENEEIVESLLGVSRETGAETNLICMRDVDPGVEFIPEVAKEAMRQCDVLIGITKTTAASVIHHDVPEGLQKDGELRGLIMVKRSFDALTSSAVLDADYSEMSEYANRMQEVVQEGSHIYVTSDKGTDFEASIESMPSKRSDFAHNPGEMSVISWGEVYQGPEVGTAEGTAVIDGPILEYGWPSKPVEIEMEDGKAVILSDAGIDRVYGN